MHVSKISFSSAIEFKRISIAVVFVKLSDYSMMFLSLLFTFGPILDGFFEEKLNTAKDGGP